MTPTELTNPLRAFKPGQDLETFTVNAIKTNLLSCSRAGRPRICKMFTFVLKQIKTFVYRSLQNNKYNS